MIMIHFEVILKKLSANNLKGEKVVECIKKHIRVPRSNFILLTESVAPFVEVEDVLMPSSSTADNT